MVDFSNLRSPIRTLSFRQLFLIVIVIVIGIVIEWIFAKSDTITQRHPKSAAEDGLGREHITNCIKTIDDDYDYDYELTMDSIDRFFGFGMVLNHLAQIFGGFFGQRGIDIESGSPLESGHPGHTRDDFDVPMIVAFHRQSVV